MGIQPIVATRKQIGLAIFLLLSGIIFISLGAYLIYTEFTNKYPSILLLVVGGFNAFIGLLAFVCIFWLNVYILYNDRLDIYSILGYLKFSLQLSDITGWAEKAVSSKYGNYNQLYLYLNDKDICISSQYNKSYGLLKPELTKNIPEVSVRIKRSEFIIYIILILCISTFSFAAVWQGGYKAYIAKDIPLTEDKLVRIKGVLKDVPDIYKSTLTVHFAEIPEFEFIASGNSFSGLLDADFLTDTKSGDTIYVDVLETDYKKKLSAELPLSFWDKYSNYNTIHIYGLANSNYEYLSLERYNIVQSEDIKSDKRAVKWFLIFGILVPLALIYFIGKEGYVLYEKYKVQQGETV